MITDELRPLAADARVAVVSDNLLDDAMAPIMREVAVAALHEARGAVARRRERGERAEVPRFSSNAHACSAVHMRLVHVHGRYPYMCTIIAW